MRKEQKHEVVEKLKKRISEHENFYIADSSNLTVAEVSDLRRLCFNKGVTLQVAKNTLVKKALEESEGDFAELYEVLVGPTSLMFAEQASVPAKVIKEFRKKSEKPILKAAKIETDYFIGDENLESLASLKSKEELLGEIINLLQSPAKNVIAALQSGKNKLGGIVKTLSERSE